MSQSALAKLCPLTQSTISNIANWKYSNKISSEKCKEFGDWYRQYMPNSKEFPDGPAPRDSRQTFHPEHEIPILRKWFETCKNPSEEKLKFFTNELNKGHVRQERPKLTVTKIKIWWKNEKQRERRLDKKQDSTEPLHKSHDLKSTSSKNTKKIHSSSQAGTSKHFVTSGDLQRSQKSSSSPESFTEGKTSTSDKGSTRKKDTDENVQESQMLTVPAETSTSEFKSPSSYDQFLF